MQDPQNPFGQPTQQTPPPYAPQSAPIPAPSGELNSWNNPNMNAANTSGMGSHAVLPDELKGMNAGAFFLPVFWSIAHSTWIGLLCLVPYVGIIMSFVLLFKGNEMAWQNRKWNSIQEFKDTQKKWTMWSVGILVVGIVLGVIVAVAGN